MTTTAASVHRWREKQRLIGAITSRQLGLITRAQAIDCGLRPPEIQEFLRRGHWERVRRGVYRLAGAPRSAEQDVLAACLACGPGVVASHRTGAVVWKVSGIMADEVIDVIAFGGHQCKQPGVRCHRVFDLPAEDRAVQAGIPVTSAARTLVDCAPGLTRFVLQRAIDDARRRRLASYAGIDECATRLAGGGKRGLGVLFEILAHRIPGEKPGDSDPELHILRLLEKAGLPTPEQQVQVAVGRHLFLLDLCYREERIDIEYDSWDAHGDFGAFDHDRVRDAELSLAGYLVIRPTSQWTDAQLIDRVRRALALRGKK